MRIACLGGGPAGLYFAIAMKRRRPGDEIVVIERNRPYDTFGWGVVLSDETLANLAASDPESAEAIRRVVRLLGRHRRLPTAAPSRARRATASAASAASACSTFSRIGRVRSASTLRFETEFESADAYRRDYDLVVAADGANSKIRSGMADVFKPDIDVRDLQVHLARHAARVRRRVHLHLRGDRARLDLGARLPVRCRYRDVHRRMLGGHVAPIRLRRHEPGGDDRGVRADLREPSRRRSRCC